MHMRAVFLAGCVALWHLAWATAAHAQAAQQATNTTISTRAMAVTMATTEAESELLELSVEGSGSASVSSHSSSGEYAHTGSGSSSGSGSGSGSGWVPGGAGADDDDAPKDGGDAPTNTSAVITRAPAASTPGAATRATGTHDGLWVATFKDCREDAVCKYAAPAGCGVLGLFMCALCVSSCWECHKRKRRRPINTGGGSRRHARSAPAPALPATRELSAVVVRGNGNGSSSGASDRHAHAETRFHGTRLPAPASAGAKARPAQETGDDEDDFAHDPPPRQPSGASMQPFGEDPYHMHKDGLDLLRMVAAAEAEADEQHADGVAHDALLSRGNRGGGSPLPGAQEEAFDVVDGWRGEAIADYDAATPAEISFRENDLIHVEQKFDNGWFLGSKKRSDKRGLFPGSFIQVSGAIKIRVPRASAPSSADQGSVTEADLSAAVATADARLKRRRQSLKVSGSSVQVFGLTSTAGRAMNDRTGVVQQEQERVGDGRVSVLLDGDDTPKSIKAENLRRPPPAVQAEAERGRKTRDAEARRRPKATAAQPPASETSQGAGPTRFIAEALEAHNNYRKLHGVPPLTWDSELAESVLFDSARHGATWPAEASVWCRCAKSGCPCGRGG